MMVKDQQPLPPWSLLAIRDASRKILASEPILKGWDVRGIRRLGSHSIGLQLGPESTDDTLALEWEQWTDPDAPCFMRGERFSVSYRSEPGTLDLGDESLRDAWRIKAMKICELLVTSTEDVLLVESLEKSPSRSKTGLNAADLTALIAPWFEVGQAVIRQWVLVDIHDGQMGSVVFNVLNESLGHELIISARCRDLSRPAAARTASLDLSYRAPNAAAALGSEAAMVVGELALVLEILDGQHEFVSERPQGDKGGGIARDSPTSRALNLAISAPCNMKCSFCSVPEFVKQRGGPDPMLAATLSEDIRRGAARGLKTLRINGIEPLRAPYLFDLLELARDQGYQEFSLHSTCRPLKSPDFCRRFLSAMPDRYRIYVPIYGSTAEIHDGVVGASGAFDDVMAAVENLRGMMGEGGMLIFTTVLLRPNLDDLSAMGMLVKPLGRWWEVHFPFPNSSSKRDVYRDVAVRMTDALHKIYPAAWWPIADLPLGEVHPCVALRHQEETGHALVTPRRIQRRLVEPSGTFYESAGIEHSMGGGVSDAATAAVVSCPHMSECALASFCHGKIYALYAERFGLDEFKPISLHDLEALENAEEITAFLAGSSGSDALRRG